MSQQTYEAAVGGLVYSAAHARRHIKTDPRYARKLLEDAVRDMLPHLHSEFVRDMIREEMKR